MATYTSLAAFCLFSVAFAPDPDLSTAVTYKKGVASKWLPVVTVRITPQIAKTKTVSLHHCAGTVIAPDAVLTAASCFVQIDKKLDVVDLDQYQVSAPGQASIGAKTAGAKNQNDPHVIKVITHPNHESWNAASLLENDIAILKIDPPMDEIPLVKLPIAEEVLSKGTNCTVAGWGVSLDKEFVIGGFEHKKLMKAHVEIIKRSDCNFYMHKGAKLPNATVCAGKKLEDGKFNAVINACTNQGDRGGPLFCPTSDGSKAQFGIVSYTRQCEDYMDPAPGIYTDLRKHMEWIHETLASSEFRNANHGVVEVGYAYLSRVAGIAGKLRVQLERVADAY